MSETQVSDSGTFQKAVGVLILLQPILKFLILALIFLVAFFVRQFSVVRFESIIHEFDPWFNYRATQYFVEHGWDDFINWFDEFAWYPLGRIVGGTVYPGLMLTSGFIHWVLNGLNMTIHIREVCVFLAPLFSGLTAIAAYLLTKELKDEGAGLLAAAFMGIAPGYISRSVAGSYDNEGIAIFALIFTYYCWIKALKLGSMFWGAMTSLVYFYMVSAWGGYVFITNLIPLHVLTLLLMGRYTSKIYISYCTFFGIGHLLSMQIPFVGFLPVKTSEHMAFIGVFGLLQLVAFSYFIRQYLDDTNFLRLIKTTVVLIIAGGLGGLFLLSSLGYIAPFAGRFYSLWDTGYAKIHIPIIASVSEHQPTPWTSYFTDLNILVPMLPVGVWCCFQNLTNENVFILLYAATAVYFSGVMVRLMLTLTPCACIMAAIAFSSVLDTYMRDDTAAGRRLTKEEQKTYQSPHLFTRASVVGVVTYMLIFFSGHCTHTTSTAYSSPSVVLAYGNSILDDFRESYYWLRQNTSPDANIMSWWDYGYQIGGFSNRSTLVDNNTWNNTHIAMVGKTMASNETEAAKLMEYMDVDYVLIIFGGYIGYSGDDINKFLWMVRIAEGEFPDIIQEHNYFNAQGQYKVDASASQTMKNSLMYKMSYYRFGEVGGQDRVRNTPVDTSQINFEHLDECYTSEHWMVRIYKVRKNVNRDTPAPLLGAKGGAKKRGINA
ncbi:dolichyl-diphosphooligosaccharide-protein glycosyltransferase subunit STT3B [Sphaeroforma arctica JP610]|uniref:dolichyl-diphosphooligosaccharide--protein glycotransferase n=1 Tax=Sphaeroforma arctica JP610 TaxID=667725 RepID=A0A0L0FJ47_9EUKA|nr:dolichyl-diphosphooligosaccharide-protein glycosyltransferase subunit STT3B [Sphaeroforma arctica JP610]KNC76491.1 dolichyl-diphosphooligosaccharide-protein glycosyltransferase subunit STT3B [Sphaeroforma arctica JP610]|eukprot:XP_014150393.1 dolichyl-diphosphooligosaccharide-protein glycosyltransferase subunit STT3B [Sphaeroforma arctica JP610]